MHRLLLVTTLLFSPSLLANDLLSLYRLALQQDPQLASDRAEAEIGHAQRAEARAGLLPSLSLSASQAQRESSVLSKPDGSSYSGTVGELNDYEVQAYTLSLRQTLFDMGRFALLRSAGREARAGEYTLTAAQQALMLRVATAYFDTLAAIDNLALAEAEQRALAKQQEEVKQRFNVGLDSLTELRETQARFDLSVAESLNAANQLDAQYEQLATLVGETPKGLRPLDEAMPLMGPDPADLKQWSERASKQSPLLLAARERLAASQGEVSRLRGGHYPSIDLVASKQYSDYSGAQGRELEDQSIGVELSMSLFAGGETAAQVRAAIAQRTQAEAALEAQQRLTLSQTRRAYRSVIGDIRRIQALRKARASSQLALEATLTGVSVGSRTNVDVLNARRELFRARRDYARARYDYVINSLQLKQASGTLAVADLEALNQWLKEAPR